MDMDVSNDASVGVILEVSAGGADAIGELDVLPSAVGNEGDVDIAEGANRDLGALGGDSD